MCRGARSTARGSRNASCHRPLSSPQEPASPGGGADAGARPWRREPNSHDALAVQPSLSIPLLLGKRDNPTSHPRLRNALATRQIALHHRHLPPGLHPGPPSERQRALPGTLPSSTEAPRRRGRTPRLLRVKLRGKSSSQNTPRHHTEQPPRPTSVTDTTGAGTWTVLSHTHSHGDRRRPPRRGGWARSRSRRHSPRPPAPASSSAWRSAAPPW